LAALLSLTGPASGQPSAQSGSIDLAIEGARSQRGLIRICLSANPRHFPDCSGDPAARTANIPASATTARFDGLAPGTYAVSLIHDENSNGRMDTMLMMPREGFGFSRNPRIGMGPPRFQSASFAVEAGAVQQTVRLRYML
jgi:uncharacterized protein (DUF2141 family)